MPGSHVAFVGIDVGGTRIKVAAFRRDGKRLADVSFPTRDVPQRATLLANGYSLAALDPEALWQIVQQLLAQLTGRIHHRATPVAVAVTGMGGPLVALNGEDEVLYPLLMGGPSSMDWKSPAVLPEAEYFRRTGYHYGSSFLPLLAWLWKVDGERAHRVRRLLTIQSFITFRLTGEAAEERSTVGATGLWSHRDDTWEPSALDAIGIVPGSLAPVVASGCAVGTVRPSVAAAIGGMAGATVSTGGNDYVCAAAALGVTGPDQLLDVLGTYEVVARPHASTIDFAPAGLDVIYDYHVVPGGTLLMLQMVAGGQLEWLRTLVFCGATRGTARWNRVLAEAATLTPEDMGQLAFAPHLFGRYYPARCSAPGGAFLGLEPRHGPAHLYRAVIEALSYTGSCAVNTLIGADAPPPLVVLAGGGTRNRLWCEMKANFLQQPLMVPQMKEASALGAALLAGVGSGYYLQLEEAIRAVRIATRQVDPTGPFPEHLQTTFDRADELVGITAHGLSVSQGDLRAQ